jgi:hypothetical protein
MCEKYELTIATSPWNKRWVKVDENIDKRPMFNSVMLKDEIHFWTIENNIEYEIFYDRKDQNLRWYLIFKNKADAMLFKLTWS